MIHGLQKMFFKNLSDGYFSWVYVARFWQREGCSGGFRKRELPPCGTELIPDSSKPDLPLAKAEPISKAASLIT